LAMSFKNFINYFVPKERPESSDVEAPVVEDLKSLNQDEVIQALIVGRTLNDFGERKLVEITSRQSGISKIPLPLEECKRFYTLYQEHRSGQKTPLDCLFTKEVCEKMDFRWGRVYEQNYKVSWGNQMMILLAICCICAPVAEAVCCNPPLGTGSCTGIAYYYDDWDCDNVVVKQTEVSNASSYDRIFYKCTSTQINPWDCVNYCSDSCTGDDYFCNHNHTCNGTKCNCLTTYQNNYYWCLDDYGNEMRLANRINGTCYADTLPQGRKRALQSVTCPTISVESDRDNIRVTTDDTANLVVYVTKDNWSYQGIVNSMIFTVTVDQLAKIKTGYYQITIMQNNNKCYSSRQYVDFSVNCQIIDCIYCVEVFSSFNCLPMSFKIFAGFMIALTIMSVVAALPCIWALMFLIWKVSMVPCTFLKHCIRKQRKRWDESVEKAEDEFRQTEVTVTASSSKGSNASKSVMYQLMVCCIIATMMTNCTVGAESCSLSPVVATSAATCVQNSGTTEACTMTYSTTFTIQNSGQTVCLNLMDSANKLIGVVNVTYVNRTDKVTLADQYVTARWKGYASSVYGCYNNGWCDDSCVSQTSRTMFGFTPTGYNWPGSADCRRSGGCWANGCFYCVAGCTFENYALVEQDSVMTVSQPTSLSYTPYLSVSVQGNTTVTTFAQTGTSQSIGSLKFDILGTFQGSTTLFGNNYLVYNSTKTYWGAASAKGIPQQQNIGDIQATTVSQITTPSVNAFIFDPAIVSASISDTSTAYFFKNPGMNNVNFLSQFPLNIAGQIWTYSSGLMSSIATNPGTLAVTMTTLQPITITRTRTVVCPQGTFMQASGCYNCNTGSVVFVKLSSKCSAGTVLLSVVDPTITLTTLSLILSNTEQTFEVTFQTTQQVNSFNLKISGDSDFLNIPVAFAAVQNITDVRTDNTTGPVNDNTQSGGIGSPKSSNFASWDDFINGAFGLAGAPLSWINMLVFAAAVLGVIILIAIVGFVIYKMATSGPPRVKRS